MAQSKGATFQPDYAVCPGLLLKQELEHYQLSQAEFARRIARTPKLVSEIIAGNNPIEPETAIQFERVLGIGADLWLRMESDYRLHLARQTDAEQLAASEAWLEDFPVRDLSRWNVIRRKGSIGQKAQDLLAFFAVASPAAFEQRYKCVTVHYRKSAKFQASRPALLAWLRYGEVTAASDQVMEYDESRFRETLNEIRNLTTLEIREFKPRLEQLCASSGVVFRLIPPLPKTRLSGAAFWMLGRTPVIQQSLRYKTNDHFWFTFFHEAGHILLHSQKAMYADDGEGSGDSIEAEANDFATDVLVGRRRLRDFISSGRTSVREVKTFAAECGIHPGIIVGMLQHYKALPWNKLNSLKATFEWEYPESVA